MSEDDQRSEPEDFALPAEVLAAIAAAEEQLRQMHQTVTASVAGIQGAFAAVGQITSQVAPVIEQISRVTSSWARILDGVRKWREANIEVLAFLAPRGWLLSPSAPAFLTFELRTVYESEDIDAVESRLLEGLDAATCEAIVEGLTEASVFKAWDQTLHKATQAHVRGDYELAIPVWLITIDGICRSELGTDAYSFQAPTGRRARAAAQKLAQTPSITEPEVTALLQVLTGLGGKGQPLVLNRHEVLHGLRPTIGTVKDSIQCILVLEVLHWLLLAAEKPGS